MATILDLYNRLNANDVLPLHQSVLGTILGGMISLPPEPIEYTQLREHFNTIGVPVVKAILNPLSELHARLDITGIVEAAFRSFQFRYNALHDFKSLLAPTVTLCDVTHTQEYPWATEIYSIAYDVLNDYAVTGGEQ